MKTRRWFLYSGGAVASVSAASAALAGYAWMPGGAKAREPWSRAGESYGDPRLDALSFAIFAPNPHNRQPWMFALSGSDTINVYCDLDRRLPHTDPFDRQITIGFGCMLELLRMAAAEKGFRAEISAFPEGEPAPRLDQRPIARVVFREEAASPDPLFASVLARRSYKEVFLDDPLTEDALKAVLAGADTNLTAGGTLDPPRVSALADLSWRAWMMEYETPHTRRESVDLMRIGNRAVANNPDGIDLGGVPMGLAQMAGLVAHETLDTPGTTAYESGIDLYRPMLASAKGHVWIVSADNSRASQLEAGRAWVRMNLAATRDGVAFHPISQALQEFDEMAALHDALHAALDVTPPGRVQMLGRIGRGAPVAASPRWPLETRLVKRET